MNDAVAMVRKINEISFDITFWTTGCKNAYIKTAKKMIDKGFTKQEAIDILQNLYEHTACEFGE